MWQHMFSMPVMLTVWRRESKTYYNKIKTIHMSFITHQQFTSLYKTHLYKKVKVSHNRTRWPKGFRVG